MPPNRPPTFEDGEGNTWQIKLTYGLAEDVLEQTQVDLIPDDNDVSPIVAVALSAKKLAHILWICIQRQADAQGVDERAFKSSLGGQEFENGWHALREAVLFFIQSLRGTKQAEAAAAVFEAAMKFQDAQAAAMLETLKSSKTETMIKEIFQEAGKQAQADLKKNMQQEISARAASASSVPA